MPRSTHVVTMIVPRISTTIMPKHGTRLEWCSQLLLLFAIFSRYLLACNIPLLPFKSKNGKNYVRDIPFNSTKNETL